MDYEEILFGLQPILNASSIKDVPMNDVYLESYLTVMDQLAVSLREPTNRDIVGKTGLLSNLVMVLEQTLDFCFHDTNISNNDKTALYKISSEMIRCIANAISDNDNNREILSCIEGRKLLNYYIGGILKLSQISSDDTEYSLLDELQMRSVVLLRNFCIGNVTFTKKVASFIRGPLFIMLKTTQYTYLTSPDKVTLGSDLLNSLLQVNYKNVPINDLLFLSQNIKKISSNMKNEELPVMEDETFKVHSCTDTREFTSQNVKDEGEEEDEEEVNCELLLNLSACLETIVVKDESIDFTNEEDLVLNVQKNLLLSLDCLELKTFNDKLIVMRRLVSCAGNISANLTNSNKIEPVSYTHLDVYKRQVSPASASVIRAASAPNFLTICSKVMKLPVDLDILELFNIR